MPQHYHVRIMPRASDDIVTLCTYIEQNSPCGAALVAQKLLDAIDSLELLPYRCKVHEHRRDPAKTVRAMLVSSFIVYYRVVERNQTVEVLTIRHGSRRQPRRFG